MTSGKTDRREKKNLNGGKYTAMRPRPKVVRGNTMVVETGCGKLYVTINQCDKGNPFEIFAKVGKVGGCGYAQTEAISRMASAILRLGGDPGIIVKQLKGISCHSPIMAGKHKTITSCADAMADVIGDYLKSIEDNKEQSPGEKQVKTV